MSPWLFNLFMDAAIKEVRDKAGDVGIILRDEKRNTEWNIERLMFADNTVLLGDSEEKLERLVKRIWKSFSKEKNVGE